MFIALSFIGKLPKYIIYCIFQIRIFFKGEVYLIINDLNSEYLNKITKYNIKIIKYEDVISHELNEVISKNYHKFKIEYGLKGREELFIRSIERFFLLHNLMKNNNLIHCLFLELDNLIYYNPEDLLVEFEKFELCYMFDNYDRCSSGLMFVRDFKSLEGFLKYNIDFINNSNEFLNEMTTLYRYYILNKDKVQILPTYIYDEKYPSITFENFGKYCSLFDALSIGSYLLGVDPYHTNGTVITGLKGIGGLIDYTNDNIIWKFNEIDGLRIPYFVKGNIYIKINNLHVHSKLLENGLSKSFSE